MEYFIQWLAVMVPIIFSPGPTNIVVGSSGAQNGLIKTFPLMAGVNSTIFIMAIVVGTGLGNVFNTYPFLYSVFKYIGIAYILYLAFKFFSAARVSQEAETLKDNYVYKYFDGVILQATNPKVWTMIFFMFSVFYKPESELVVGGYGLNYQVIWLSALLFIFNTLNNFVWAGSGHLLMKTFGVGKKGKFHNYILSFTLLGVAIWLFIGDT